MPSTASKTPLQSRPAAPPASFSPAERRAFGREWLIVLALVVACCLVYVVSPVTTSTDSAWTFHVAASLLQHGDANLDEYRGLMNLPLEYRVREVDGHIYSYYPVATPLLVAPAVWAVDQVYPLVYHTDFYTYLQTHAPDSRTAKLEKLLASVIAALAAALMYLIARCELSVWQSVALAFIFAFATSLWSTASRALWQHGPSALFLAGALYLLFRSRERPGLIFFVGLILGFSYLIRPTNAISVAFIGLYLLLNDRKQLGAYALGVSAVLLPYAWQNLRAYGNIFPPYSYQLFERLATPVVFMQGLAGTLISPARGLFIFTPIFLFSLVGIYFRLKADPSPSNLDLYLAGILFWHWLVISLFEDWGGAWSIGPRYFVDVIPLLAYFLIPVVARMAPTLRPPVGPTTPLPADAPAPLLGASAGARRKGWSVAFLVTVLISFLIQLHSSTSIDPWMWNGKPQALVEAPERKWDWGDLQFLRGFCPGDPLEGRAPACWINPQ